MLFFFATFQTKMSEKDVDVDEGDNDTEDKEEAKGKMKNIHTYQIN